MASLGVLANNFLSAFYGLTDASRVLLRDAWSGQYISMRDITDKEFEKIYLPFYNNVNEYLNNYVIPDLVAFYLANGYSRHCLSECNLINHINSAIDIFNCRCDISRLIPKIKEILIIKYNLIIVKDSPMILKKYY